MILKVGFLVGASVAAFAIAQISSNSARNRKTSTDVFPENCDPRFQEGNIDEAGNEKKAMVHAENREGQEAFELEFLSNVVEEMEQRQMIQEKELLELYGLKQQQICFTHLQNQLKAKIMKIDMLKVMKNALTDESTKLHEDINKNLIAKKELEIAKERIKEIQATGNKDDNEMKERIKILNGHVSGFNKKGILILDNATEKKLLAMKDAELEVAAMKRKNSELQLEARELTVELETVEARVTALTKMTKEKVVANVEEEISSLRNTNENLLEKVERLQKNKFDIVEELVYQRWLNVCLRFEIQDYNTPREKKRKHDLKKKLSFDSQVRSKRTSLDSISSRTSSMDSDENSNTTTSTTPSYSSDQKSAQKKSSLIHNIKRWGKSVRSSRSKEEYMSGNIEYSVSRNVVRRFSMSDVPLHPSILRNKIKQDLAKSPETPTPRRARRVSFSDSVMPLIPASSDAAKLEATEDVTGTSWVELKIPTSSDASNLAASEDVTDTSWVELEHNKLKTSSISTENVEEANDSKKLRQEDMGDDDKGESEMVNNGEIGQTEDQYQGLVAEELGIKTKSNIEDQNLHILSVVILIFLILLVFFNVLLFRL